MKCPKCSNKTYVTRERTGEVVVEKINCSFCKTSWQNDEQIVKTEMIKKVEERKNMKLLVYKIRENAKLPVRAHSQDAGADVHYSPDLSKPFQFRAEGCEFDMNIPSMGSSLLATGLRCKVPEGYMLEIKNKGGIAAKRSLVVGSCVVDSGYDGEVFVNLHNIGGTLQTIKPGEKIAQAVLIPISLCEFEETLDKDLNKDINSKRGDGCLGSTGA